MGRPPERVAVVGTLLSAWGLAPAARGCPPAIGAGPEPITAQLGAHPAQWRFLRVVGLYLLLWERCN